MAPIVMEMRSERYQSTANSRFSRNLSRRRNLFTPGSGSKYLRLATRGKKSGSVFGKVRLY